MALILASDFKKQCFDLTMNIVQQLKESIQNNVQLDEDSLKKMIEPLLQFISEETRIKISAEEEEIRASLIEKYELQTKEAYALKLKRKLDASPYKLRVNRTQMSWNTRRPFFPYQLKKKLKRGHQSIFSEFNNAKWTVENAERDQKTLISDTRLFTGGENPPFLDEYRKTLNLTIDEPATVLLDPKCEGNVIDYIKAKGINPADLEDYTKYYKEYSDLTYGVHTCKKRDLRFFKNATERPLRPLEIYEAFLTVHGYGEALEAFQHFHNIDPNKESTPEDRSANDEQEF